MNRMNNRTRKLGYVNLNWPRCSARVTESLALTDGSFCRKQNNLYFRLCKTCEFMMCILVVDHQFNRMHPWCSWECMLPGRCSPDKRCHTFWNRNIVLLPILLGKVSCVPRNTLCELYVVKFWEGLARNSWSCHAFPKRCACASFLVFLPGCTLYCIVYSGGFFRI